MNDTSPALRPLLVPILLCLLALLVGLGFLISRRLGAHSPEAPVRLPPPVPSAAGDGVESPGEVAPALTTGPVEVIDGVAGEKAVTTLVTGRVLLPNGSPAAGIEVHLGWYWECIPPVEVPLSSQSLPYRRRRVSFLTPVKADDEGKFAFGRDPADTGEIPPSVSKDLRITASRGELLASVRSPSRLSLPIKMPDFRL